MKRLLNLIIITLIFCTNLYSDEYINIRNNTAPIDGSFWSIRDKKYENIRIRLFRKSENSNRFEILGIGNDDKYYDIGNGNYKIKNGLLTNFNLTSGKHQIMDLLNNQVGKLYTTKNDILDSFYIEFKPSKVKLWCYNESFFGEERIVNNIPIIIIKHGGITTDNVKIRISPSIDSKSVKYYNKNIALEYIPKDTYVYIVARTKKKYKVKEWNNYWYLLQVGKCSDYALDLVHDKFIWAFAEFIKYGAMVNQNGEKHYPEGYPYY